MRRSIAGSVGRAAAALTGFAAIVTPVRSQDKIAAQTIYSLNEGASCRDQSGKLAAPPLAPPSLPVAAETTPFGMIKVKDRVSDRDCFFYMFEVGLDPNATPDSAACPQAAVGQEKSFFTGTRAKPKRCSK